MADSFDKLQPNCKVDKFDRPAEDMCVCKKETFDTQIGDQFNVSKALAEQWQYIKENAKEGPIGPQGPTGEQGPVGPQGPQGEIGPQGIQGIQGEVGPQGIQGPQGEIGPQGPQGIQGIQGEKGNDGTSFVVSGTVDTIQDLPNDVPIGTAYFVGTETPRNLYTFDGTKWTNQGALQGPKGDTGPQGQQGPQGPQGEKGLQGEQGIQGEIGPQGPTGEQGPQGDIGPQGETGLQGPQGIQGPKGETGDVGPQGPKGDIGPQGDAGPQGPKGDTGPQGPMGLINVVYDQTNGADLNNYTTTGVYIFDFGGALSNSPSQSPNLHDTPMLIVFNSGSVVKQIFTSRDGVDVYNMYYACWYRTKRSDGNWESWHLDNGILHTVSSGFSGCVQISSSNLGITVPLKINYVHYTASSGGGAKYERITFAKAFNSQNTYGMGTVYYGGTNTGNFYGFCTAYDAGGATIKVYAGNPLFLIAIGT